jgi:hypothetical protein
MDRAWLSSVMGPRMPSSMTATGRVKSSVLAAPAMIDPGSRRSASR